MRDDNTLLTVDLTNADQYLENELILQKDTLHIVRTFFLWQGVAYLRLGIQNHGDVKVCCTVSIVFANDFADIFEVRNVSTILRQSHFVFRLERLAGGLAD